jgi:hypothetical protein
MANLVTNRTIHIDSNLTSYQVARGFVVGSDQVQPLRVSALKLIVNAAATPPIIAVITEPISGDILATLQAGTASGVDNTSFPELQRWRDFAVTFTGTLAGSYLEIYTV